MIYDYFVREWKTVKDFKGSTRRRAILSRNLMIVSTICIVPLCVLNIVGIIMIWHLDLDVPGYLYTASALYFFVYGMGLVAAGFASGVSMFRTAMVLGLSPQICLMTIIIGWGEYFMGLLL
ncbi:MAG: hypothetical protein AAF352_00095 [Pseudomonadota bacterium]